MEDWFADFLDLPNGIPSHDTFNPVFAALDPEQFWECFLGWMRSVASVLPAHVLALDGKTVRRSHDRGVGKEAIHMVSAWASQNRFILAQVKVDEKSDEITALPELLRTLAVSGCIVTIDAKSDPGWRCRLRPCTQGQPGDAASGGGGQLQPGIGESVRGDWA